MTSKKTPIQLTAQAVERIKQVANGRTLRLSLKAKGCSNMGYVMGFVETPEAHDEVFAIDGVTIAMAPQAVLLMLGSEMDFVQTPTKSHFVFNNPQEKSKCGCGQSFKV